MKSRINAKLVTQFREKFESNCITGILLGYERMRLDNQYKIYWKENKLTAHLAVKIDETGFFDDDKYIKVTLQAPLYNDDIVYGDADPDEAPIIDFKFSSTWSQLKFDYYAEAKNLSEQNWTKPNKPLPIRADKQIKRYIETGIEHYLTSYYPEGCLVGYVVNGKVENIVTALNERIAKLPSTSRVGQIEKDPTFSQDNCFSSENQLLNKTVKLCHLILQLA